VFIENFMSSACLLWEIKYTEKAGRTLWVIFNEICYRAVTEFLTLENVQPQQVHNRMAVVYCEYAPSYATVKCGAAVFHQGRRSHDDEPRSGRPPEAVCEENCCVVEIVESVCS